MSDRDPLVVPRIPCSCRAGTRAHAVAIMAVCAVPSMLTDVTLARSSLMKVWRILTFAEQRPARGAPVGAKRPDEIAACRCQ